MSGSTRPRPVGARGRQGVGVLLVVDADDRELDEAVAGPGARHAAAHGSETPQRVAAIRARFGRRS
jgi:phosphoribosylanthranilate isomerase